MSARVRLVKGAALHVMAVMDFQSVEQGANNVAMQHMLHV